LTEFFRTQPLRQLTRGGELTRLRDEVKRLVREQEELRKRLDKFESGKH
jgi:hypothetical protein